MHLLLTDRLTCSRCGPEFGLILLAEAIHDRMVAQGLLGCPNCRDQFPIVDGFGDLRAPPRRDLIDGLVSPHSTPPAAESERLAALIGVAQGPGTVLLVGSPAAHGGALGGLLGDIQVLGLDPDLATWPDEPGWSRIVARPGLPFFSRALRGVAVDGRLGRAIVEEAARVVAPRSRVVVVESPPEAADWLREAGLEVMAEEPGTIVGARA
jgi:uncharacterized protein YbaR (Trm112 family)